MTRDDLKKIEAITNEQLALLTCVEESSIQKMITEGNAVAAKVEARDKEHADALAMKDADHSATKEQLTIAAKQLADYKALHGRFLAAVSEVYQSQLGQNIQQKQEQEAREKRKAELQAELASLGK